MLHRIFGICINETYHNGILIFYYFFMTSFNELRKCVVLFSGRIRVIFWLYSGYKYPRLPNISVFLHCCLCTVFSSIVLFLKNVYLWKQSMLPAIHSSCLSTQKRHLLGLFNPFLLNSSFTCLYLCLSF